MLRSAAEHGLQVEQLSPAEVTRRWPGITGDRDWQAVIEHDAGFLLVEDCVRAHQRLATEAGATCLYGVEAIGWQTDGNGITVATDAGMERCERLVVAGGPWNGSLVPGGKLPLRVLRKHQYWLQANEPGFDMEDGFPCFFHETANGFYYGFPSHNDSGVKVARHSGGVPVSGPQPSHPRDDEDRELVNGYVGRYLPGVSDRVIRQSGCYYTSTPDEHFIVGVHPDHPQVTLVAGLSGHGFKFTSVLGEIASQLATAETPKLDIGLFAIDRFA